MTGQFVLSHVAQGQRLEVEDVVQEMTQIAMVLRWKQQQL